MQADPRLEQLQAELADIARRVAARHPEHAETVNLPDLLPLVHARDAAQGRVAAIGSVNPRRPGLLNDAIQAVKRTVARSLNWLVRPQIEFNQASLAVTQSTIESLNEVNRALAELSAQINELRHSVGHVAELPAAVGQMRLQMDHQAIQTERSQSLMAAEIKLAHERRWADHQAEWQRNADQFARRHDELSRHLTHLVQTLEDNFRLQADRQQQAFTSQAHALQSAFDASVQEQINALQERFWADLSKIRDEYERLIHTELRVVRQRLPAASASPITTASPDAIAHFDYTRFSERFRGNEDYVKQGQQQYLELFRGRRNVLDLGCGRGEFLDLMRDIGSPAQGVDASTDSVALCESKGLRVTQQDLFAFLESHAEGSFDGIFCSQVIEHIPLSLLPTLVQLIASRLSTGGLAVIETPNPQSLAIFATHFFLDPTHQRPIPAPLLVHLMEESGLGRVEVMFSAPAVASIPSLQELPEGVREALFGALDYAAIGRKL